MLDRDLAHLYGVETKVLIQAVKRNPNAFTEQGVAMLSSVLRSSQAIEVNVHIMRMFVKLRRIIDSHAELADRLFDLESRCEHKFQIIFDAIKELTKDSPIPKRQKIGFGHRDET